MSEIVQKYFEIWNDLDRDHRDAAIRELFTEEAVVLDPDWTAEGRDAVVEAIGAAREKLGDFVLGPGRVIGEHNDSVLYTWYLGEESSPVATGYGLLALEGGRIRRAYNYFG
ncbi:nuclear transport factor 2 family protein [Sphaerisporangium fuscum]|uniref:nuclear transport factor 2 family protein n=1 Tax=Sphaerisporangium fuscum TaxID=2835868 RepID=UPI001BDD1574|nr:nuclear transport factor 2 family protein [Sphaerisporangium fuscum]